MKIFSLLIIIGCILSCQSQKEGERMLINVPQVINRPIQEIEQLLGKPDSVYNYYGSEGPALIYRYEHLGDSEIFFYNKTSKEILIHDPMRVPFDINFVKYLGIYPRVSPDYMIEGEVISWANIPGYSNVKAFVSKRNTEKGIFEYKIHAKSFDGEIQL